jgi:hypothetical protein
MPISFSNLSGGASSSTTKTYYGGTGTFTVNLPSAAYNVTPHTSLELDGTELAAGTDAKVFGSITTLKSSFGATDFSSNTEVPGANGGNNVWSVATNGSRIVASGSNSTNPIYYSDNDGASWTAASGSLGSTYQLILNVVWESVTGRFLAAGKDKVNNFWQWLQSTDGNTWTQLSKGGSYANNTTHDENLFSFSNGVTVGMTNTYITVLKPNSNTVTRYNNTNYRYIGTPDYANNRIYMLNRNNSSQWYVLDVGGLNDNLGSTNSVTGSSNVIDAVASNGEDTIVAFYANTYRTSTDGGATWTNAQSIPGINSSWDAMVAFLNGSFMVYGYNSSSGYVFAVSQDGLTWSNGSSIEYSSVRQYFYYGGKLYIAWQSSSSKYNFLSSPVNNLQATIETLGELVAPDA